ncbi:MULTISPECIES: DUF2752 domain-containing protein [Flavobacterium]|jgi:hypothetical protein|uniref:DUF2752 domain-containing protein n=1 Tax=Flavobacterium jumunjinense TaxID=998845 RepID=A0ABV5GSP7_9FLAO|nr:MULTISPECIES: DUF2752 domain-containing protein [Flavobacterium]
MEEYMIPCFSKTLFGVECLGCGIQRSLVFLLKGELIAAFKIYPAIYTLILFFLSISLHFIDKRRNYNSPIKWLAIINGFIMITSYLIKINN